MTYAGSNMRSPWCLYWKKAACRNGSTCMYFFLVTCFERPCVVVISSSTPRYVLPVYLATANAKTRQAQDLEHFREPLPPPGLLSILHTWCCRCPYFPIKGCQTRSHERERTLSWQPVPAALVAVQLTRRAESDLDGGLVPPLLLSRWFQLIPCAWNRSTGS